MRKMTAKLKSLNGSSVFNEKDLRKLTGLSSE